ncbi:gfo/Idh/MocA family oxidoreductase [Salibacterium salarium]|uniref:Gfo/Idh/MocA family oxidoreductase n=1 Tax=Salibacterium salarium TaxID=284579 RepID=A0A3R9WUX9_9BACI|nr:Gfo/Idh/MocA family oxidoreductase [Salibacterium salarium]RSL34045.1 gfo/Idh/MocA family oxidoreductase [Salibacterium salarium]
MTIKIGMIGTGNFSKKHAEILTEMRDVKIAAFYGTSQEKADNMAKQFDNAKGYGNLTEMLETENLDGAYVCVPPMSHGAIEKELIDRDIPFFVEKPLSNEADMPADFARQIEEKSLITSVGYHFRYKQNTQTMKNFLEELEVGMVTGQWMSGLPQPAWWKDQDKSGGQFNEQTIHIVDLLRYTVGEVKEVNAVFGNTLLHEKEDNFTIADVGTVTLTLENGVIANITNTCVLPPHVHDIGITFYTDDGILSWQPDRVEHDSGTILEEYNDRDNPYEKENEIFIHAVKTGDTSEILSDYSDALKTQKITAAALESAKTRRTVTID